LGRKGIYVLIVIGGLICGMFVGGALPATRAQACWEASTIDVGLVYAEVGQVVRFCGRNEGRRPLEIQVVETHLFSWVRPEAASVGPGEGFVIEGWLDTPSTAGNVDATISLKTNDRKESS